MLNIKIDVYVPSERGIDPLEGMIRLPEVPAIGDMIYYPELAPTTGVGAGLHLFKVISRTWGNAKPFLHLSHVWDVEEKE
jgi:hypothetical protein